MTIAKRWVI